MTQVAALSAMSTNVNVGMNEVVSVFVSKYEDGLFAKKDDLSAKIRALKHELTQIDEDIKGDVVPSLYEASVPSLGITFKLGEVNITWEANYCTPKNTLVINVDMMDSNSDRKRASYVKQIHQPIADAMVQRREDAKSQLNQLNGELVEVLSLIKSVGRKERQIRGKISEMKLAESGMAELLNNTEMLQLVELK